MIPENETVRELSDRVDHVGLTLSQTDRLPDCRTGYPLKCPSRSNYILIHSYFHPLHAWV